MGRTRTVWSVQQIIIKQKGNRSKFYGINVLKQSNVAIQRPSDRKQTEPTRKRQSARNWTTKRHSCSRGQRVRVNVSPTIYRVQWWPNKRKKEMAEKIKSSSSFRARSQRQRPFNAQYSEQQSPSHRHSACWKWQPLGCGAKSFCGGLPWHCLGSHQHSSLDSALHSASDCAPQQIPRSLFSALWQQKLDGTHSQPMGSSPKKAHSSAVGGA